MSSAKEIRTKIKSIGSTRKITKAMEMVAASKMRRAQDRMSAARPYAEQMRRVVSHFAHAHSEYKHPYFQQSKTESAVGFVVVSSDRGLCGGLNVNLFRQAVSFMDDLSQQGVEVRVAVVGKKASSFFKKHHAKVVSEATSLGEAPSVETLIGVVKVMIDDFYAGKIQKLYLVSNQFVNTMTQKPQVEQLIPVAPSKTAESEGIKGHWDYLYEPEAPPVVDYTMNRYIESLVYQGVVENIACEQSARMVAMKAATDNAGKLIDELQLVYNKARQAAITQELSEIVSGAAAV